MPQPVRPIKLIGQEVTHRKYGNGRIITQADDIITVRFAERTADFLFPAAFVDGHLALLPTQKPTNNKENVFEKIKSAVKPFWVSQSRLGDVTADGCLKVGHHYGARAQRIYTLRAVMHSAGITHWQGEWERSKCCMPTAVHTV